jgi:hypothetical protein
MGAKTKNTIIMLFLLFVMVLPVITQNYVRFVVSAAAQEPDADTNSASTYMAVPILWHAPMVGIGIMVPANPSWAYNVVLQAITEWNREQAQFVATYYPNDTGQDVYHLYATTQNPAVVMSFQSTGADLTSALGLPDALAMTNYDGQQFTIGINAALINVPDNATSHELLYRVVLHELGHVMGLGELMGTDDIMNQVVFYYTNHNSVSYISTTDLYAIRQMVMLPSAETAPVFVFLPTGIPYQLINVDSTIRAS